MRVAVIVGGLWHRSTGPWRRSLRRIDLGYVVVIAIVFSRGWGGAQCAIAGNLSDI